MVLFQALVGISPNSSVDAQAAPCIRTDSMVRIRQVLDGGRAVERRVEGGAARRGEVGAAEHGRLTAVKELDSSHGGDAEEQRGHDGQARSCPHRRCLLPMAMTRARVCQ